MFNASHVELNRSDAIFISRLRPAGRSRIRNPHPPLQRRLLSTKNNKLQECGNEQVFLETIRYKELQHTQYISNNAKAPTTLPLATFAKQLLTR